MLFAKGSHVTHGWSGLLIPYGLTAAGVLIGLIIGCAKFERAIAFPLMAVPTCIAAAILWSFFADALKPKLGETALLELFGAVFFVLFGSLVGKILATPLPIETNHKRGTLLEPVTGRLAKTLRKSTGLTLAGLAVHPNDETKDFKMIGTTGSGKSTAIRELLQGALERGDRAVIADPDGSYLDRFYDPTRGDVILNPFDARATCWDPFAEMTTLFDADQLALSLILDTEGTERPWRGYARVFLTSLLRQLHRVKHDDVTELYRLLTTTPVEDLCDLLNETPAGPYLAQDNGKFFGAVRAVANTHLAALEHIACQTAREGGVSHRQEGQGVLFLPYRANEIATPATVCLLPRDSTYSADTQRPLHLRSDWLSLHP